MRAVCGGMWAFGVGPVQQRERSSLDRHLWAVPCRPAWLDLAASQDDDVSFTSLLPCNILPYAARTH